MKKQTRKIPASSEKRRLELIHKKKLTKGEAKELRGLQIQRGLDSVSHLMGQIEHFKTKQVRAEAKFRSLSWKLSSVVDTALSEAKGTIELCQSHE